LIALVIDAQRACPSAETDALCPPSWENAAPIN
jgi:hypothetical protein